MFLFANDSANWTAWATVAYAVLTLVLAAAAIGTFIKVREQLTQLRTSTREQIEALDSSRKSSLLPLIVASGGTRLTAGRTTVEFANIGVGPATGIEVRLIFDEMSGGPDDVYELDRIRPDLEKKFADGAMDRRFRLGAMGARADQQRAWDGTPLHGFAGWYCVGCMATYIDVFGDVHEQFSMAAIEPVGN